MTHPATPADRRTALGDKDPGWAQAQMTVYAPHLHAPHLHALHVQTEGMPANNLMIIAEKP